MTAPRAIAPQLLTLLAFGGAVAGALLALWLVRPESFESMLIVVVGVLFGTTLAVWVFTSSGVPSRHSDGYEQHMSGASNYPDGSQGAGPGRINRSTGSGYQPRDNTYASGGGQESASRHRVVKQPPVAPPPLEVKRAVLPFEERDSEWWSATSPAAAGRHQPVAASTPPLDLSGYVEAARVVQCPNCASFRINVRHVDVGYSFSCQRCGHKWDWQPNTPWPKTVKVSRRLRADPVPRYETDRQGRNTSRRD